MERAAADSRPLNQIVTVVNALGDRTQRIPWAAFSILVLAIGGLRFGLKPVGPSFIADFAESARAFPAEVSQNSSSLGIVLIMRILGIDRTVEWWIVAAIGGAASLLALALVLRRLGGWWRVGLVAAIVSPAFGVAVGLIGHYDQFTIAGSVTAILARRRAFVVIGGVIACVGNPEQTMIAALALALVSVGLRDLRRRAALIGLVALIWNVALRLLHGTPNARFDLLVDGEMVLTSLRRWLADWPLATWAFLGPMWIVLAVCLLGRPLRVKIAIMLGVVAVPAISSILTLDGTRVFVATGLMALLAVVSATWRERWSRQPAEPQLLGFAVMCLVFIPGVIMLPSGEGLLHQPYDSLLNALGWLFGPEKMSTIR